LKIEYCWCGKKLEKQFLRKFLVFGV